VPRPRKPDEQHILAGTWRADRHGDPATQIPADGEPAPPAHLAGEALALWQAVVPGLVSAGVARARDTAALTMLCEWWARYRRCSEALDGLDPAGAAASKLMVSAAIASDKFNALAARFGLTPADRAKLRADAAPKKSGVLTRDRSRAPPNVS
jgi:P27 family predicted phage terminase small subunit